MAIVGYCSVYARKNKKMIFTNFKQDLPHTLENTF